MDCTDDKRQKGAKQGCKGDTKVLSVTGKIHSMAGYKFQWRNKYFERNCQLIGCRIQKQLGSCSNEQDI